MVIEARSDPREIELKLALEGRAASRLRSEIGLLGPFDKSAQLVSRYYDTKDQVLRQRGFTCRIRKIGESWVQTIKAERGPAAGLFDRQEWESGLSGEGLDYLAIAATGLGQILDMQALIGKLEPIFETHIERTVWRMMRDRSEIEVALDKGMIKSGNAAIEITELELELKHGSTASLFKLARRLELEVRGQIGVMSKAERGYALVDGGKRKAAKAERPPISRGLTTGQAIKVIAHSCIRQFRLNQPLIEQDDDPEALHQARVALRRLRSLFSVFKKVVADKELKRISGRLKRMFRALGRARNLDVYLERLRSDEAEGKSRPTPFIVHATRERERAYERLRDKFGSTKFRALMLDLLAWIETGSWLDRDTARGNGSERPVEVSAVKALDRLWRKFKRAARRLDHVDQRTLHRLRIQAKQLRYACEFFSGIFEERAEKRRGAFLKALAKVQDYLGVLNDWSTSRRLTRSFAKRAGESSSTIGKAASRRSIRNHGKEAGALLASAKSALRTLLETKPFW